MIRESPEPLTTFTTYIYPWQIALIGLMFLVVMVLIWKAVAILEVS